MAPRVILWDFGDTLVDQRWMLRAPDRCPEWSEHWLRVVDSPTADAWFLGELSCEQIAQRMADATGLELADVLTHMRAACTKVRFYPEVTRLIETVDARHAIVTVNPDLFTNWIVPEYRLAERFAPIVTSWEERSLDKAELCRAALARLSEPVEPHEALLVDNRPENVEAWEAVGGRGHVFGGEDRVEDLGRALREFIGAL